MAALFCAAAAAQAQTGTPIRLGMIDGLSGPFANAGEAVVRNLRIAIERVNARGGVKLPDGPHPFELVTFDSKGNVDESLIQFRSLVDKRIPFVLQGNSSAVASALVGAINRQNAAPARCPRAVPELFGRRSIADQRELQLLAFPFRRQRGYANASADRGHPKRAFGAQGLPGRPGLQLRPSGGAFGA
jgi:hypothetical protein